MVKDEKKDDQINIRLSKKDKELFDKTGYKRSELVPIFNKLYYNTQPVGIDLKLKLLKIEKQELKNRLIAIDHEIAEKEKQLISYNDLDLISESTISLIKIAIEYFLNKSIGYKDISEFLEDIKTKDLIDIQSNKSGYSVEDYKKLVRDYYYKYYD